MIHIFFKIWNERGDAWNGESLCGLSIQPGMGEEVIADHKSPHACPACVSRAGQPRNDRLYGILLGGSP